MMASGENGRHAAHDGIRSTPRPHLKANSTRPALLFTNNGNVKLTARPAIDTSASRDSLFFFLTVENFPQRLFFSPVHPLRPFRRLALSAIAIVSYPVLSLLAFLSPHPSLSFSSFHAVHQNAAWSSMHRRRVIVAGASIIFQIKEADQVRQASAR